MDAPKDLQDLRKQHTRIAGFLIEKGVDKGSANLCAFYWLMDLVPMEPFPIGRNKSNPIADETLAIPNHVTIDGAPSGPLGRT